MTAREEYFLTALGGSPLIDFLECGLHSHPRPTWRTLSSTTNS